MKSFVVALCVIAVAFASDDNDAQVLRYEYEQTPEGNYRYGFDTDNGIQAQVDGVIKTFGKDESAIEVIGSNSYKNPEGETISLKYVANENGYVAQGAHLPTPPPTQAIPDYILRSLEFIKAHPYVEKKL